MKTLQKIALVFTIIGALNWGMVGLFDFNLVTSIFGNGTVFMRIAYVLIAICGLINILLLFMEIEERHMVEHRSTHTINEHHHHASY